ncbi:MAG: tripartite tricarboxylate transporter substrate-binding protein, partial [Geminicoccaceae bacterium]
LRIINVQTQDPVLLYTTPDTGWSNLSDMVTSIQGEPGKYVFGSSGPSSAGTVMANQFIESLGLDVKVAAYQGGGKTRKAMLNGEVHFSAAGASAPLAQKDSFVPLGVFWDEADQIWNAPAINDALEAPGVTVPNGAAYRFIAAHGDVSDERFEELVSIVEKATKDEQFIADAEARSIGSSWFGPETSTEILQLADEEFRQMLGAGN